MKRSEINHYLREAKVFFQEHRFCLPPFAYWSPQDWQNAGTEADEIRRCMLGWDVTSFGASDFLQCGLLLFTLRNGLVKDDKYPKTYAEKIMVVREQQVTPLHFHHFKAEDIINRGGGELECVLFNANDRNGLADSPVTVSCDGLSRTVPAGGKSFSNPVKASP